MNKIEYELIEQLVHQLTSLDDPTKRVYLKELNLEVLLDRSHVERNYSLNILEERDNNGI